MSSGSKSRETGVYCPLEWVMNIISRRWTMLIIAVIGNHGSLRFNEILRLLPGISPKVLSDRLKELENAGLIERKVYPETPPRVEYKLTKDGVELRRRLTPLLEWAVAKAKSQRGYSPCLEALTRQTINPD